MGGRRGWFVGNGLTPRAGVAKAMAPGGAGKNQQGLSIIELMIALAIAGIVMGGVYNVFISQKKVLGIQDQDAEMHQAARAAMDAMVREFRMLGYGVPNSTWDLCNPPCPVAPPAKITSTPTETSISCPPASTVASATPTEELPFRFWGNLDATRTTLAPIAPPTIMNHACVTYEAGSNIECETGLTTLKVDCVEDCGSESADFEVDDTIYVEGQTFTGTGPYSTHWHTARVTAISTAAKTLTISPGLNFEYVRGSTVNVVKIITYSFDSDKKQIDRKSQQFLDEPSTHQPLVENIANFFLSYTFADGDRGLPDDTDAADTTNDTSNIRTINLCITARTPKPDPTYKQNGGYRQVTVTSQVTPRNLP